VRGKAVSEDKNNYAADGLKAAVEAWEESSFALKVSIDQLHNLLVK
jgi:hypothetical protein